MTDDDAKTTASWSGFRALWDKQGQAPASGGRTGHTTMALILWVVALITIFVAWDGAASYATVPDQLPYFLSGGLLALVLTLIGCAVYVAGALARRDAANRSAPNEGPKQGEAR